METVTLGSTGITVNKNGFGCIANPENQHRGCGSNWQERHMMQVSLSLILQDSIQTARRSLALLLKG